ncbi:hypothetical protein TFLX_00372 [Thermoflexales bacterium]|nr:hypothetical protein TFLX_00372 [Thermoflexales bacterium]
MSRNKLILIIGLAFLIGSCTSSLPSSSLAQVKGVLVTKGAKIPSKDAVLRLWKITGTEMEFYISSEEHPTSETKTDAAGVFLFTDVPPGLYRLGGKIKVESGDVSLNLDEYNGNKSGEKPAIEVAAGQTIDLSVLEHCPHQVCGLPPTVTPTAIR